MGKIWTPENAGKVIPAVRVRPLVATSEVGVRVRPQHLHWQLGRYVEDLSFGPGGRGRRKRWMVVKEAEQHNVVLNQTYDFIPVHGFLGLHRYAAVGTGSTPPSPTQTGLVNEVARTIRDNNNNTTGTQTRTRVAEGVYDITVVREFTETEVGNRNLTEWGFSPSGTAGANLMSRELFRDGNGTPIVITPAADQRLRLFYAIRVSLSPVPSNPANATIDIQGLGTFAGKAFISVYDDYTGDRYGGDLLLANLWVLRHANSGYGEGLVIYPLSSYTAPNYNAQVGPWSSKPSLGRVGSSSLYTLGTGFVELGPMTYGTTDANTTWYGVSVIRYSSGQYHAGAFVFAFNQGVSFAKTDLYRLTIGKWKLTWGL